MLTGTDLIADVGICYYNGYTFNGATNYSVDSRNVRDEAERTTLYLRHEITAHTIIASGSGADVSTNVENIRDCLSKDGQALTFAYKGFGVPLNVNGGSQIDVKWGPKTEMTHWEPIGSSGAIELIWKCTVCIPACQCCATYTGVMAFNFDVEVSNDPNGDSTQTISGYLEIAQTRAPDGSIPDSADNYWEQVIANNGNGGFQPPKGFKRSTQRHLSKDKSRLDFQIIDAQIPSNNAYPIGCTDVSGKHAVNWSRANGAGIYRNTISMEIAPQAGINGTQAWNIFGGIAAQRIAQVQGRGLGAIIYDVSAEEDLWGRVCGFRLAYTVTGSIQDFLGDNGLWSPIGTDWSQWSYSLSGSMFAPRGNAGLSAPQSMDAIIDLCSNGSPGSQYNNNPQPTQTTHQPTFTNKQPPVKYSYLKMKSGVRAKRKTPTTRQRSVQSAMPTDPYQDLSQTTQFGFPQQSGQYGSSSGTPDVICTRGIPAVDVTFWGDATRAGWPIPKPALASVGGINATECGGDFYQWAVGNYFGLPVFRAVWSIDYLLATQPSSIDYPDNLAEQVVNNGQAAQPTS